MSVTGTWYNELGSEMNLSAQGASITGTYQTAVGDAGGIYQLVGSLDVDGNPAINGQAIAWVVVWNNAAKGSTHSITAWSGQYQILDGVEEITTLWLLTQETPTSSDWASTLINHDLFTRTQPTTEQVAAAKKRGKISQPAQTV